MPFLIVDTVKTVGVVSFRLVTRTKSKSGAVVKRQRICGFKNHIKINVKGLFKSGAVTNTKINLPLSKFEMTNQISMHLQVLHPSH